MYNNYGDKVPLKDVELSIMVSQSMQNFSTTDQLVMYRNKVVQSCIPFIQDKINEVCLLHV